MNADTEPTGLNADGTVAVPPLTQAGKVNYLNWSAALAPRRPTVVVSHVSGRDPSGKAVPGGFAHLADAKPGDEPTVTTTSGRTVTYRVVSVKTVPKATFPTSIYDPRKVPKLVLITCGGQLDRAARSYRDNVIVEAVQV